jgi:hypothetical protein
LYVFNITFCIFFSSLFREDIKQFVLRANNVTQFASGTDRKRCYSGFGLDAFGPEAHGEQPMQGAGQRYGQK